VSSVSGAGRTSSANHRPPPSSIHATAGAADRYSAAPGAAAVTGRVDAPSRRSRASRSVRRAAVRRADAPSRLATGNTGRAAAA